MEQFVQELIQKMPLLGLILMALGSLVVIGQAVVFITPTKKDDEFLDGMEKHAVIGSILEFLKKFAVIQKK